MLKTTEYVCKSNIIRNFAPKKNKKCVICGMSNSVYKRPDGVWVVPVTALKD